MQLRVVNWEEFQGDKRRPNNPWVKLHKKLLMSRKWYALPEKIRWQYISVLLLDISDDGIIPNTIEEIAFKLRISTFDPKPFIDAGLLIPAATCAQLAADGCNMRADGCLDKIREEEIREEESSGAQDAPAVHPLSEYEKLSEFFPILCQYIKGAHTHSIIPKPTDTSKAQKWRDVLARLVEDYSESEIIAVLTWVFVEEDQSGSFSWRRQVQSVPGLLKRTTPGEPRKFDKIVAAWRSGKGNGQQSRYRTVK